MDICVLRLSQLNPEIKIYKCIYVHIVSWIIGFIAQDTFFFFGGTKNASSFLS